MAGPFQTPYDFSENATVIIQHQKKKQLKVKGGNLAGNGGTGQMVRWNVKLCGDNIIKLQHSKNGKYLRITRKGSVMDVKGVGGKFTKFKVHQQIDGTVKLESCEFPGKYPAVQPKGVVIPLSKYHLVVPYSSHISKGVAVGNGGKWTKFAFYTRDGEEADDDEEEEEEEHSTESASDGSW